MPPLLHAGGRPVAPADSFADFLGAWTFDSPATALVAVLLVAYVVGLVRLRTRARSAGASTPPIPAWRTALTLLGLATLAVALAGPPDAFADDLFFLHMTQHLLLILVAAPLLLAGNPLAAYMWCLPEAARAGAAATLSPRGRGHWLLARITAPRATLPIYIGTLYAWHLPVAYQAAIDNSALHDLEHATMFAAAALFWWPLAGPAPARSRLSYPQRILYLMVAITPSALLGAVITLAGHVLYGHYETTPLHWGLSAQEDQNIGGLIMWVPGNLIQAGAATVLFFKWYAYEERKARRGRGRRAAS